MRHNLNFIAASLFQERVAKLARRQELRLISRFMGTLREPIREIAFVTNVC